MKTRILQILFMLVFFHGPALCAQMYSSPVDIIVDQKGDCVFVAEKTAKCVSAYSAADMKKKNAILLAEMPESLVLSRDAKTLYVAGGVSGKVFVVDTDKMQMVSTISVGHTPCALALSPDESKLYVCNRFNNSVSAVDLKAGRQTQLVSVLREPVDIAISSDGAYMYVANLLPDGRADVSYVAASVSVIDAKTFSLVKSIRLSKGMVNLRGIYLSPDNKYAYVTGNIARYFLPTTQLERGWMNTSALAVIDIQKNELLASVLLDEVDQGAANPWGICGSPDGKSLYVTHAGTHQISVIDRGLLHAKLNKSPMPLFPPVPPPSRSRKEIPTEPTIPSSDTTEDLSFLYGIRSFIDLKGNGPRGIAISGMRLFVAEYFSDTIGVVDMSADGTAKVSETRLNDNKEIDVRRKGEIVFNDAQYCYQKWQSCATCHPDVRVDGLNWDLLNDGVGNPKNTKSLFMTMQTPPVMVTGIRDCGETAVRTGMKFIQFSTPTEEQLKAVDEFLRALAPVPSPYLKDGKLTPAAERGKKVFRTAGCAVCHPAPLFTDKAHYVLGLGNDMDKNKEFDVPTLLESWRTAPYLYDGRAATIKDVLTSENPGDRHGKTSTLSSAEIDELVEYILSL